MKDVKKLELIFEQVIKLNKKLRTEIHNKKKADITGYRSLLLCAFEQAEKFARAVKILVQSKLSHEASPIVRTFFELFITLKLIAYDKDLALRFGAFAWVRRKKLIEIVKKHGLPLKEGDDRISEEEIEETYKQVIAEHGFTSHEYWFQPKPPNLFEASKITGDEKNYDLFYRYLSDLAHVNILSFARFNLETKADEIIFDWEDGDGYTELGATLSMLLTVVNLFNGEFELGFQTQIDTLMDSLVENQLINKS